MDTNVIKGKWKEIKGALQEKWGKLTDDEFEEAKGNFKNIVGIVQRKYGYLSDEAHKMVNEVIHKFKDEKPSGINEEVGDSAVNQSERMRDKTQPPFDEHIQNTTDVSSSDSDSGPQPHASRHDSSEPDVLPADEDQDISSDIHDPELPLNRARREDPPKVSNY